MTQITHVKDHNTQDLASTPYMFTIFNTNNLTLVHKHLFLLSN